MSRPRDLAANARKWALGAYLKVAEPRVARVLYFIIYLLICIGGIGALISPPLPVEQIVGGLVYAIALLPAVGGFLGWIGVLPGWWWVERAAVVAIGTGFAMYAVALVALGSSSLAVCFVLAMAVSMAVRWTQVTGSQLSPER